MNKIAKVDRAAVAITFLAFSAHAETFTGTWVTEDNISIVTIESCSNASDQYCGYLVRFPLTDNKALNRALCHFRVMGGMKLADNSLTGGWLYDPESGAAYNLTVRTGKTPDTIDLHVHGRIEMLGKTISWIRFNPVSPPEIWKEKLAPCAP
ncbi:hypothetical protein MNBD_GAMMA26-368 [hydrothermal vent metagenome]|uniref:DUF2147 domain-containing protein n=1 Tax=hydrothermal vent metagenome TaxID=652676 RepID=A0A3B1BSH9_9ZZZZ